MVINQKTFLSLLNNLKHIVMTNSELMLMTISELTELNKRLIEVVKLKRQQESFVNKETLENGMYADYIGSSSNIIYKEFQIIKINRTKADCKCLTTGKSWTISLASLKAKSNDFVFENNHSIVDKTERQPNNIKQW